MPNRSRVPIRVLFIIVAVSLPIAAGAQEQNSGASEEDARIAQLSLSELRREVYQAEEDYYDIYNKLNDDRDYELRCFYENPTGTRVKNHVCRARFVTRAYERHAARNRSDLSRIANQDADPAFAEKTAIFQAKMETLVNENAELQAAFIRYNTLLTHFVARREEQ